MKHDILHLKDFTIVDGERRFAEIFEGNINLSWETTTVTLPWRSTCPIT